MYKYQEKWTSSPWYPVVPYRCYFPSFPSCPHLLQTQNVGRGRHFWNEAPGSSCIIAMP